MTDSNSDANMAEARRETLSKVAHDLRNPLNNISMNAELVKLKLQQAGDPVEGIAQLDQILQECKSCGQLLEAAIDRNKT